MNVPSCGILHWIHFEMFISRSLLWISSHSRVNPFQAVSFPYHMFFKAFWRDNYVDIIYFPVWCQDVLCFSGTREGTRVSLKSWWLSECSVSCCLLEESGRTNTRTRRSCTHSGMFIRLTLTPHPASGMFSLKSNHDFHNINYWGR